MALVRPRVNQAALAVVGGIVSRYGQRMSNELRTQLEEGLVQALEQGRANAAEWLTNWSNEQGRALGNWGFQMVQGIRSGIDDAIQRGGELANYVGQGDSPRLRGNELSDLIPENHSDPTEGMQIENGGDGSGESALMARSSGGGPNAPSKETPISSYPNISYGLPETHTAVYPWTGWFSIATVDKNTAVQLPIALNTPVNMVNVTLGASAAVGAVPTKGFYRDPLNPLGQNAGSSFPVILAAHGAASVGERPQWWEYFRQLYEWYTVLGCEWKVVVHNPSRHYASQAVDASTTPVAAAVQYPVVLDTDIMVAEQMDTFSATAGGTGNQMPQTVYEEVKAFKNIKWTRCPAGKTTVITGHYKPGQAAHNIVNDGDVKTWTTTGTVGTVAASSTGSPNLNEILTLNFYQDPLNNTTLAVGANIEVSLKYIIQMKDLRLQARYPNSITASADIVQNISQTTLAVGNPMMKW